MDYLAYVKFKISLFMGNRTLVFADLFQSRIFLCSHQIIKASKNWFK